jgi:flavorubredoxin
MSPKNVVKLSDGIYWVGVKDWNRRLFDGLIPLPRGTSYNSYLVTGNEKKALIDTVNPGFEKELEEKIRQITDPSELDYVIMNHAEPDHAGAIPYMMSMNSNAKLVTSSKGAKMAQTYFRVPPERIKSAVDGESIELGGKTLRFIEAPMLHWPETMFTYVPENKTLLPCDFLGSHVAQGTYDDEVDEMLVLAQRYFGEIMMPFSYNARKALEKIRDLEIEMIGPSHGPVHRNPKLILDAYRKWANGETRQKATLVYVTMWNSTEKMIMTMAETLASEGVETSVHNLVVADIGDIAKDLVDSRAIVLGAPTVLGAAHPLGVYASYLVKALRPPAKYAVVVSSYGWGGGALKHVQETLGPTKMEIVGTLEVNGPPTDNDTAQIVEISKRLARKIKET